MRDDLVDSLLPKKTGQKVDLSAPLSFLSWVKADNRSAEYRLLPARAGDRLSSGIIVFKEGFREIEDNWFSVPVESAKGQAINIFGTKMLDDLRAGRENYIAGMAIQRIGIATSIIAATVWFQDEADAVDFALRMNNANS